MSAVTQKRKANYRERTPLEKRKTEFEKTSAKFPKYVPVIVENSLTDTVIPQLKHTKFLAGKNITVGQFLTLVRNRVNLKSDQAIFIFINNTLPPLGKLMSEIQKEFADPIDGFVYFLLAGESVFG